MYAHTRAHTRPITPSLSLSHTLTLSLSLPLPHSPPFVSQEWVTPQPTRRPDTQPEFERLDTPLPKPLPGDPEAPDDEAAEEEERKRKKKKDPDDPDGPGEGEPGKEEPDKAPKEV